MIDVGQGLDTLQRPEAEETARRADVDLGSWTSSNQRAMVPFERSESVAVRSACLYVNRIDL